MCKVSQALKCVPEKSFASLYLNARADAGKRETVKTAETSSLLPCKKCCHSGNVPGLGLGYQKSQVSGPNHLSRLALIQKTPVMILIK